MGNNLPQHIKYCIKQIQYTNPIADIYFLTNLNVTIDNPKIKIIKTQDLIVPNIGNYYINHPDPLWRTAMLRLYYLESFLKQSKLENIIHFDNDVLIYENLNEIGNELIKHNFLITYADSQNYVLGFSYIKNANSLAFINEELLNLVVLGEQKLDKMLGSMTHEMILLKYINKDNKYINTLPLLPTDENYQNYHYCFDPSSYGQYLGGSKPEQSKFVGEQLIKNAIQVKIKNKKPILIWKNQEYKIFNLHVHNKKLQDFTLI